MLKKRLTDEERYGLSEEEIKLAQKYLRKHKTAGALKDLEAAKLFELYLLGESLAKIAQQFPHYPMGQITLTAALRGWARDRDKMTHTLQDRVRAKVVKSVLEQVDFLTAMMSVANAEHLESMVRYCQDPINNPKPALRIDSIKAYKDVAETLYKIVSGATPSGKDKSTSPMFDALTPRQQVVRVEQKTEEPDVSTLMAQAIGIDEQQDNH
jgi:uncharacterized protein with HEPN domain